MEGLSLANGLLFLHVSGKNGTSQGRTTRMVEDTASSTAATTFYNRQHIVKRLLMMVKMIITEV